MQLAGDVILVVGAVVFVAFTFVIAFGAPFLPTLKPQVENALDLIDLKQGQMLLELGSGDGRVLRAAAERGLRVVGYELNPILVIYSILVTWRWRKQVSVRWGSYWWYTWPKADGVFVFMMQPQIKRLDKEIVKRCGKGVKLVSFAYQIKTKKPIKKKGGIYLYQY